MTTFHHQVEKKESFKKAAKKWPKKFHNYF